MEKAERTPWSCSLRQDGELGGAQSSPLGLLSAAMGERILRPWSSEVLTPQPAFHWLNQPHWRGWRFPGLLSGFLHF